MYFFALHMSSKIHLANNHLKLQLILQNKDESKLCYPFSLQVIASNQIGK